jgi:preprotein translocase subunit Sec61beta
MSDKNKVSMPSSMGGIVRYFDEYHSNLEIKPEYAIALIIIIIILIIALHSYGANMLGL